MERESMDFDVVIIGAGPSGLATAIRLKQLNADLNVCVLEKGAEVGSHILSGAVFEPRALDELLPDWKEKEHPLQTPVNQDKFVFLTEAKAYTLPTPKQMHNQGNYIISLGQLCRWLAEIAESLGVEIFPGFPAQDIVVNEQDEITGIITGDFGLNKDGQPGENYQPGMILNCKRLVLAEGCRGSLSGKVINKYNLREGKDPQTYGIGLKELWKVAPERHQPGLVMHSIGWPMDSQTYGGSFIYHWGENLVSVGFVIGLDYQNPYINPFNELQRFKTHPKIRDVFEGADRISYGARALNEGGFQSLPKLDFPGGVIIGCSAGFLNVPKIKGSHLAMKSGMIAAETIHAQLQESDTTTYEANIKQSWVYSELKSVRNIRPAFNKGLWFGLAYAAIDTYLFMGHAPWTFKQHADHTSLKPKTEFKEIEYPKPDGKLTFDKLSSVFLANTFHEENQPCHLILKDPQVAIKTNLAVYDAPETRYCPAAVYEIVEENSTPRLQINFQNCIHCKTCDIKDPTQNITWTTPEGGGGPNYAEM